VNIILYIIFEFFSACTWAYKKKSALGLSFKDVRKDYILGVHIRVKIDEIKT
jgi:hypothetical protein